VRSLKYFLLPLAIIVLDQLSKSLVITLPLPHRLNPGGAFSLLAGFGDYTTLALWMLIILTTLWLWFASQKKSNGRTLKIGWALLLGGAFSNTLDRLVRGGVLDFLQVGLLPNFNPADVAIVLGLATITITLFTQKLSAVDKRRGSF
jgi:signal peptidase II